MEINLESFDTHNQTAAKVITKYFESGVWKGLGLAKIQRQVYLALEEELKDEFVLNITKPQGSELLIHFYVDKTRALEVRLDKTKL